MNNTTSHQGHCRWNEDFFISDKKLMTALVVFAALIGVVAVIGNVLVLVAIYKNSTLHKVSVYFIGSLAVADTSVGIVGVPLYGSAALTWPELLHNSVFEQFLDFFILQTLTASAYSLLAVSFDRYVSITLPFKYTTFMTNRKCFVSLVVIWVLSSALASGSFFVTNYLGRPKLYLASVIAAFVIPLSGILYMYYCIFQAAKSQAMRIASHHPDLENGNNNRGSESLLPTKAAISVAMIVGAFALFWLPNLIVGVVHFVVSERSECEAEKMEQIWLVTLPFAFLNAVADPIIYAVRYEEIRTALKHLLKL